MPALQPTPAGAAADTGAHGPHPPRCGRGCKGRAGPARAGEQLDAGDAAHVITSTAPIDASGSPRQARPPPGSSSQPCRKACDNGPRNCKLLGHEPSPSRGIRPRSRRNAAYAVRHLKLVTRGGGRATSRGLGRTTYVTGRRGCRSTRCAQCGRCARRTGRGRQPRVRPRRTRRGFEARDRPAARARRPASCRLHHRRTNLHSERVGQASPGSEVNIAGAAIAAELGAAINVYRRKGHTVVTDPDRPATTPGITRRSAVNTRTENPRVLFRLGCWLPRGCQTQRGSSWAA